MRYCVLGSGLMGKAVAYDLLQQYDTERVLVIDKYEDKIEELKRFLKNDKRLTTKSCDIENKNDLIDSLSSCDAAVSAISYRFNEYITRVAIETKTNLCDLGGNNDVVNAQLKLDDKAKISGVSIIPDCGLAPGMVSILVKHGLEKYNWADTVKIRVGGLPINPINELKYERLFSIDGLINEYVEPVRVLRNGEIQTIEPLTEIEAVEFLDFHSDLEAFTTSGGTSTMISTLKGRLKNLDYKTIRYSGHLEELRRIGKGNFKCEFEKLPICHDDVTLVKITFEGNSRNHELTIMDFPRDGFTSMMRMTAFSASIIAQMQARKEISIYGVCPQEQCVPSDIFISELKKRNIVINGL